MQVFRFFEKPFDVNRLYSSLDKAMEYIDGAYVDVFIYSNKEHKRVLIDDIIYIENENRKTHLYTKDEINEIIEIKKQAYEKAKAEEEARRKAKEEAERQARERARQQSTTTSSSSQNLSSLQSYAHNLVINTYGWSEYDFDCLVKLWNRESGWNPNAHNSSSGAHGIPQSLPASKMASEGSDYYTNGETQIRWGLKYIAGRYGSPANAWAHSQQTGWY